MLRRRWDAVTRTRERKHSLLFYAISVPKKIIRHPANRTKLGRRVLSAVTYQTRKRLGHPPSAVSLGDGLEVLYSDSSCVSNLVYFGRYFEYDEIHFVERLLRPGDVVVDGGANIGLITLIASSLVGERGTVHAIEPAPRTLANLRANLAHNNITNTIVHEVCLSDAEGEVAFMTDWDVSNAVAVADLANEKSTPVRSARLDDLVGDAPIILTKLDLEGSEMLALSGAMSLLSSGTIRVILMEAYDHQLRRMGSTRSEVIELLAAAGYDTFEYHADINELTPSNPTAQNFVAVHRDSIEVVRSRLGLGSPVGVGYVPRAKVVVG